MSQPRPTDPRADDEQLLRVKRAFNQLLRTCDDVYVRRSDQALRPAGAHGEVEVPDPFSFGGIDGLTEWGWHNVIKPLNDNIDTVMAAVNDYHETLAARSDGQRYHYPAWLQEWRTARGL